MSNKIRRAQDVGLGNRGAMLRLLRDAGPLPRAELARRLELSPTTMTRSVAQLIDEGCVVETASVSGPARVGRPAIGLSLVPEARWVVGVQVGAGFVQIGLADLLAQVRHTASFSFDLAGESPTKVIDILARHIDELVRERGLDRRHLLGVGIAAPGPVDRDHRRNVLSINLGWRDVPFADRLEATLGLPTVVDHNVRTMALAEARYGAGRGIDALLYIYARTGLGAGVVLGGEPFRSGAYGITELGHFRVVEKGRPCACGSTGCLETVVSEPHLVKQVTEGGGDAARLMEAVEEMPSVRDDLVEYLSTGLAAAVNLLNPELILLGGIFVDAPQPTFDRIGDALRAKVFPVLRDAVRLERSTLGRDAGVVGGAAFALDRFFYSSLPATQ